MIVKLSSKGQLVIPRRIRQALNLKPGTEFEVELIDGQIVMRPVIDKAELKQIIGELRRLAKGTNFLDDLEREHRWEIEQDRRREQSLPAR